MITIYYAFPFSDPYYENGLKVLTEIKNYIDTYTYANLINFIYANKKENIKEYDIFSDILNVKKSAILIAYMPINSIGVSMEISTFKNSNYLKPVFCYDCIKHPWIDHLCSVKENNVLHLSQQLLDYISNIVLY